MTRRLVLLRHGRTAWNATGRAQGHTDVELDAVGHEQARTAAGKVAALGPAALWSSDLARARRTADYVAAACGLEVKCDQRLREFDVGERSGLTPEEFARRFPGAHERWCAGDLAPWVPGAEEPTEVARRMGPVLHECLESLGPAETGVVVTHGAALKVGLVALLGWPLDHASGLRGIENCAWATVEQPAPDAPLRLASYNQR